MTLISSNQTKQLIAAQERSTRAIVAAEFGTQAQVAAMRTDVQAVSEGIQMLTDVLDWGLADIAAKLDAQSKLLQQAVAALESPAHDLRQRSPAKWGSSASSWDGMTRPPRNFASAWRPTARTSWPISSWASSHSVAAHGRRRWSMPCARRSIPAPIQPSGPPSPGPWQPASTSCSKTTQPPCRQPEKLSNWMPARQTPTTRSPASWRRWSSGVHPGPANGHHPGAHLLRYGNPGAGVYPTTSRGRRFAALLEARDLGEERSSKAT